MMPFACVFFPSIEQEKVRTINRSLGRCVYMETRPPGGVLETSAPTAILWTSPLTPPPARLLAAAVPRTLRRAPLHPHLRRARGSVAGRRSRLGRPVATGLGPLPPAFALLSRDSASGTVEKCYRPATGGLLFILQTPPAAPAHPPVYPHCAWTRPRRRRRRRSCARPAAWPPAPCRPNTCRRSPGR